MKIIRQFDPATIQKILQTGEIELELTAAEAREVYLEEQRTYRLSDAEDQFKDYFYRNFGALDNADAEARFTRKFGISGIDVIDDCSGHYLVDAFVDTFERCHDCNNAENDVWEAAIIETLEDYSKMHKYRCPRCGSILLDSDLPEYTYLCTSCDENFYEFEAVDVEQEKRGVENGN